MHDEAGAWACGVSRRPSGALAVVDVLSMRDEFILKRARALWSRSFKFTAGYKPIWSWRRRFEAETSCGTRSRAVIERTTF